MRVITGLARGRKLRTLDGNNVRPTTDMVKESMFSIIQFDIEGRSVLDLFSGCGQLGIEAVSRGAREAVFVDKSKQSAAVTLENIKSVGFEDKCKVYNKDYAAFLSGCGQKFDIVFLDPPYDSDYYEKSLCLLKQNDLLNQNAVIVVESSKDVVPNIPSYYEITRQKFYGTVCVSLLEAKWKK